MGPEDGTSLLGWEFPKKELVSSRKAMVCTLTKSVGQRDFYQSETLMINLKLDIRNEFGGSPTMLKLFGMWMALPDTLWDSCGPQAREMGVISEQTCGLCAWPGSLVTQIPAASPSAWPACLLILMAPSRRRLPLQSDPKQVFSPPPQSTTRAPVSCGTCHSPVFLKECRDGSPLSHHTNLL